MLARVEALVKEAAAMGGVLPKEMCDELIQDDDVLINGEEEYGADCSAEFTGMFSCYLVWFKEV